MTTANALARLRASSLFDPHWYARRYPDVLKSGWEPALHFLTLGAGMGRDPGPGFCTAAYLAAYPDVAASGMNPLLHYLQSGRSEGRRAVPPVVPELPAPRLLRLTHLRELLQTGGLTEAPLAGLAVLAGKQTDGAAAMASEALGIWHLAQGAPQEALAWFDRRLEIGAGAAVALRLAPARIAACLAARHPVQAKAIHDGFAGTQGSADLHIAACGMLPDAMARHRMLNRAFALAGLALPNLGPDQDAPLLDRLRAPELPAAAMRDDGSAPLISILMAAHNATATLPTAIRALQQQSWQRFELIVIDDASTDGTADLVRDAATRDNRIRLLRMDRNGGAYAARNAGLAAARGDYITLQDADDWCHPQRLERQMAFLHANGGYAGCLSLQARVTPDLGAARLDGLGRVVIENLSSILLPAGLVRKCLGGWDAVRVSADSELLRRMRHLFGDRSVHLLEDGPLSLSRESITSATADTATGMQWFYYGARREYYEAQCHHHTHAPALRYTAGMRPFPAPAPLHPGWTPQQQTETDTVYAGQLSVRTEALDWLLARLDEDAQAGLRVGLVPLFATEGPALTDLSIHPLLRARIDGDRVQVLCFGQTVQCRAYLRLPGQTITEPHRYVPQIKMVNRTVLAPGAI